MWAIQWELQPSFCNSAANHQQNLQLGGIWHATSAVVIEILGGGATITEFPCIIKRCCDQWKRDWSPVFVFASDGSDETFYWNTLRPLTPLLCFLMLCFWHRQVHICISIKKVFFFLFFSHWTLELFFLKAKFQNWITQKGNVHYNIQKNQYNHIFTAKALFAV